MNLNWVRIHRCHEHPTWVNSAWLSCCVRRMSSYGVVEDDLLAAGQCFDVNFRNRPRTFAIRPRSEKNGHYQYSSHNWHTGLDSWVNLYVKVSCLSVDSASFFTFCTSMHIFIVACVYEKIRPYNSVPNRDFVTSLPNFSFIRPKPGLKISSHLYVEYNHDCTNSIRLEKSSRSENKRQIFNGTFARIVIKNCR